MKLSQKLLERMDKVAPQWAGYLTKEAPTYNMKFVARNGRLWRINDTCTCIVAESHGKDDSYLDHNHETFCNTCKRYCLSLGHYTEQTLEQ